MALFLNRSKCHSELNAFLVESIDFLTFTKNKLEFSPGFILIQLIFLLNLKINQNI